MVKRYDIKMYSTHNEVKSAVAERFIRTFKKMYKHMTAVSKNVYIHKLDDIVSGYHRIYIKRINIIEQLKLSLLKLKIIHILTLLKRLMIKILNFKLVFMLWKYKNNLLKDILQIDHKKFWISFCSMGIC